MSRAERYRKVSKGWSIEVENETVKNGFPVVIFANMCKADPSVGLMNDYIDEILVTTTNYSSLPFELSKEDVERCEQAVLDYSND